MVMVSPAPPGLELAAGSASRVGRDRPHNEDSHRIDLAAGIFLVADGMGGHAAGEVASALAVTRVHSAWTESEARERIAAYAARAGADERRALFAAVRDGVMDAHAEIAEQAERDEGKQGMGTTLTGLLVAGGDAFFAHAGDSRAYLVRGGSAVQLSEDHNMRARLRAAGGTPVRPGWRGFLTNALGTGGGARVARFALSVASGDRLVLATDGVHELLCEAELAERASAADPAAAAAGLVELAIERGSSDDATAIVVQVRSGPGRAEVEEGAGALAGCRLFEALSGTERLRALRVAATRELTAGELVPGTDGGERTAWVVLAGEVALAGGERVGPGALVHPDALLEGSAPAREPAAVIAGGRALAIQRGDFLELTEEEPDLGVKLYAALARLITR
jgi:PPM family protein phosphatase